MYIKFVVDSVQVHTNWERVLYMNMWSFIGLISYEIALDLPSVTSLPLKSTNWKTTSCIALSCALGVSMSYFGLACRKAVSSTYFTVIGNVCKIITVVINILMWDKHASPLGISFLGLCLMAAAMYESAPFRSDSLKSETIIPKRKRKTNTRSV